ncbi:hypothetical protein UPYG_G00059050, partial [Umbra pygmaea]
QKRDRTKSSTVLKHSTRTLVPDSKTTNQDPHTGTIANPIYSAENNQNSDVAHDITTGYCTSSNQNQDELYCNFSSSLEDKDCVNSATVKNRDSISLNYTTVSFAKDPGVSNHPDTNPTTVDDSPMYSTIK